MQEQLMVVHLEEFDPSLQNDGESSLKLELDHKSHQQIVSILLSMLETGDCAKDKTGIYTGALFWFKWTRQLHPRRNK